MTRLLLDHQSRVNDPGGVNCEGLTPLMDAVTNGHQDLVVLLVERGADLSCVNSKVYVCVCAYVCMCAYICMYVSVYMYVCACVCVSGLVCAYMCALCACACMCMHVYMHPNVVCVHVHVCNSMYMCVHVRRHKLCLHGTTTGSEFESGLGTT